MMNDTKTFLQKELLQQLQDYLQSLLRIYGSGGQRLLLAEPPYFPPGADVTRHHEALLPEPAENFSGVYYARWLQHKLNSIRFPFLGLVTEGEADVTIGVTEAMMRSRPSAERRAAAGIYALRLPAPGCVLIPPGVPHLDGRQPFWRDRAKQQRMARLLWIHILPAGAICHRCTVYDTSLDNSSYLFVTDPHLSLITQLLCDELHERSANFERAAGAHLIALLTRLERALQSRESSLLPAGEDRFPILPSPTSAAPDALTQHACHYIQTHLQEPLSPARIARQIHVSPAHLNRLLRADSGLSVMRYVAQCRRENAVALLQNTNFSIGLIGEMVGYPNPANFSHAFRRWTGQPPQHYRLREGEAETPIAPAHLRRRK